jgi:hypothetical protein
MGFSVTAPALLQLFSNTSGDLRTLPWSGVFAMLLIANNDPPSTISPRWPIYVTEGRQSLAGFFGPSTPGE